MVAVNSRPSGFCTSTSLAVNSESAHAHSQAEKNENTLCDSDAQLHADALGGLRVLVEQPTLLAAFLSHARATLGLAS